VRDAQRPGQRRLERPHDNARIGRCGAAVQNMALMLGLAARRLGLSAET
jgi:hypothetical protein